MHKVLVVDDDAEIARLVASYLRQNGLGVRVAGAEEGMRQILAAERPDLLVLDLMLPGKDGLTIIKELRADPVTALLPVLMLTARAEDVDRVVGLELGADDYLTKPFLPRELLARVRAVLRRVPSDPAAVGAGPNRYLLFGDWALDTVERRLLASGGLVSPVNPAEYALLRQLLDHPHRVVSRDELLQELSGRDAEAFDRTIDLRVSRLRRRLGDDAREPNYIQTIRNEGYVLCRAVERVNVLPARFQERQAP
jgi:two-component system, OmpR family, response regulator